MQWLFSFYVLTSCWLVAVGVLLLVIYWLYIGYVFAIFVLPNG